MSLGLLGELPCLLSTPTHEGFRISWEVFRERVGRFREAGVELSTGTYGCPDFTQARKATSIRGCLWPWTITGVESSGKAAAIAPAKDVEPDSSSAKVSSSSRQRWTTLLPDVAA